MSSGRPAISVIVCTWNRAGLLRETLASLHGQQGIDKNDIQVLVVDNNSTDETRAMIETLAPAWQLGRLEYAFEGRQGKQYALNLGIRRAGNPVLAFTDDDIVFPKDWLSQVAAVFEDPSVDLAGGKTLIQWPASGRPSWLADDMLAVLGGVDLGDSRLDPAPKDFAPGGANLIARRDLFDRVGPFSEAHFRHMDHEFGARCHSRGMRVVYDPRLEVHAPVDERCLTIRYFQRWAMKAGIARSGGIDAAGAGFPCVPRWLYRQALEDAAVLGLGFWRARTPSRFSREFRLWRAWGTISNAWHGWLWPARHAGWVERHSQKKNNQY